MWLVLFGKNGADLIAIKKPEPFVDSGFVFYDTSQLEPVAGAFKSMHSLLQTPGNYAHVVVAVTQDVVTG